MNNYKIFLLALFLFCSLVGCAEKPDESKSQKLKVLFVGNSLSYTHNIPAILSKIGDEYAISIQADCLCKPNYALVDHWIEGIIQHSLDTKSYDFVVMQQGPSSQKEGRQLLLEYGKLMADYATKKGAQPVMYMVWPSVTYYQTFEGVIESYTLASLETNSLLAPVGEVWRDFLNEKDNLSLYGTDHFHPSKKGAFLAAWVLFHSLTNNQQREFTESYSSHITRQDFDLMNEVIQPYLSSNETVQDLFALANASYKEKRYTTFLINLLKVNNLRPNHPTVLYNLAIAYALLNQMAPSIEKLKKALWINASLLYDEEDAFENLRGLEEFAQLGELVSSLLSEKRVGENAFILDDSSLHPEGIAYHKDNDEFYVSSVRKGTILKIVPGQTSSVFFKSNPAQSLMGLAIDRGAKLLWATAVSTPNQEDTSTTKKPELLKIDLEDGELLASYEAPNADDWLGDLILTKKGEVIISNSSSANPSIYRLNDESQKIEILKDLPSLASLQGLALNDKENTLFFSDYRFGLFLLDIKSNEIKKVANATQHPFKAVDGLYYYKNTLIAIHNGTNPFRIVKYQLNKAQDQLESFQFLEKALPEMNEPTLGCISGSEFFYVANSPWGAYDKDNQFIKEKTSEPIVRKIVLE